MTAALLVATSVAALLGASQGTPQSALDLADATRADSTRVNASKSMPKTVAASPVAPVTAPTPGDAATPAVPLPDAPLWVTPTATVPIPAAADWPMELPGKFLADSIVVEKGERRLTLYYRGVPVRKYRVALGRNPVGDKVSIGDYRTPEGVFYVIGRNPFSKFYKSLAISYPDSAHVARAARLGVHPGGNIMIHGLPSHQAKLGPSHVLADWTEGCIAVTNGEIDQIWRAVQPWSAIHIKP
ncbi:MAG: L,D-transpeptidase family protein [Gemmatimonadaceae bacterium]